jgi:hypothetical protein
MYAPNVQQTGEVTMFATIKSLIPEPRQADQPRHYVGRHRQPETIAARATVTVLPGPAAPVDSTQGETIHTEIAPAEAEPASED